jgi:hypothetical protein
MRISSRNDLKQKAYRQLKEYLTIALYLFLVFGLLINYKSVILAENRIPFAYHGLAIINALALAKVMLVAKDLHLGDQFNEAPLIYPTIIKSALFAILLACFKILEDTILGFYHGESFQQSISDLGGGTWKAILILTSLLFVILIPFVGFGELQRVVGEDKLVRIFLRPRSTGESPALPLPSEPHSAARRDSAA